jgi:methylthioribose-1-phosphate isomerase
MKVNGKNYRTIWVKPGDKRIIQIIDQRHLPHEFVIENLNNSDQVAQAIKHMHVRGAGLIGAAAAYGMYIGTVEASQGNSFNEHMASVAEKLLNTRPTAVNLSWAVNRQLQAIRRGKSDKEKVDISCRTAAEIANEDAEHCRKIGEVGIRLLKEIQANKKGGRVNILTHCNAGWLAFVDFGSATSPIYAAFDQGIDIHVWVDATRPRNQGARLTAWELNEYGVPHTVIPDNTGGHLMQKGLVDIVITGADRVTYTGDVANKIGTYLKALAAHDNNIPFYVALPSSTLDWERKDGCREIPIEVRDGVEVRYVQGLSEGKIRNVLLTPRDSPAANYAFDITPSRLVTGLITERGICRADEKSILQLFPEYKK